MPTERIVQNIIGCKTDKLNEMLERQFDIEDDCYSEDMCKKKKRRK